MRPRRALLASALFALVYHVSANAGQAPSAEQHYAQAVRDVPQPQYATYDVHVHVTGLGFLLTREANGKASIGLLLHDSRAKPDATFPAAYRKTDDLTSVYTPQGQWGIIRSPIFDPTWNGVYDWIRYGLNGRPDSGTALPSPTPLTKGLPVIAAVRAMGVAFYDASDGGAARCANGDSGHRVHLIAREDPLDHPLTDAVVDQRTNRFCFVRLEMRQSVVAAGYTNTIELNIADVNGESVVRSGTIDLLLRAVGISVKHVTMRLSYDHFAFPAALGGDIFPAT